MADKLTDTEVICTWMEPDAPLNGGRPNIDNLKKYSPNGWWRYSTLSCNWKQPVLDTCEEVEKLGHIYRVEERLSDAQWTYYGTLCWKWYTEATTTKDREISHLNRWRRALLHLSPKQKIKALAQVLRYARPEAPNA